MSNQIPVQPPEDARTELLAVLAAGRELGPEMDQALAESYLRKHPITADSTPGRPAVQPVAGAPSPAYQLIAGVRFLLAAAIVVVALIASGGHALWLLWLPLVMGWWWWRGWPPASRWGYQSYRVERRAPRDW
jgi:hypothetical protein